MLCWFVGFGGFGVSGNEVLVNIFVIYRFAIDVFIVSYIVKLL